MQNFDWEDVAGFITGFIIFIFLLVVPVFILANSSSTDASSAETDDSMSLIPVGDSTDTDTSVLDGTETSDYTDTYDYETTSYDNDAKTTQSSDGCNANYTGCVEDSYYDLDCADIGYSVQVIGYDEYGLDRDGDGWGCESY